MTTSSYFSDILSEISERGRRLIGAPRSPRNRAEEVVNLCDALLSGRGEASGVAIAAEILNAYGGLKPEERHRFLTALSKRYGPDEEAMARQAKAYLEAPDEQQAALLHAACEPRRVELLRRLNLAPGGTAALVAMRADLVRRLKDQPGLALLDQDFERLLATWFNRGFLVLRRIDWHTPATILDKIIRYEAVHEIGDWEDLRRRIEPSDRRCFAFFHPALIDEPLIFVEVALTREPPAAIVPILAKDRELVDGRAATTAVFYSISNCQTGLRGISFGNFLIKQVVEELVKEFASLATFVTLSPVPGFRRWLAEEARTDSALFDDGDRRAMALLDTPEWTANGDAERMRRPMEALMAHYLVRARTSSGRTIDPVARFHLGNGARLERINWLGDPSPKGLRQSAGIMVNYRYVLEDIEKNHEAFANHGEVVAAAAVKKLLRAEHATV